MDVDSQDMIAKTAKSLSLSLSKKRKADGSIQDSTLGNQHDAFVGSLSVAEPPEHELLGNDHVAPLAVESSLMDLDDDEPDEGEEFWQQVADNASAIQTELHKEDDTGTELSPIPRPPSDNVDDTTPRMESLSMSEDNDFKRDEKQAVESAAKRKSVGEDVFTLSCVKEWQGSRIKAWEGRYLNPEGYYYRFVVPGEGQQNGGWSRSEHGLFMARYEEWVSRGWKIGASWGLFSKGIPHRVGYQCMNYYRKLVSENKIRDESYAMVDGKLKQIHKDRAPSGEVPTTELGPEWQLADVKDMENNVDTWLKEFHNRSGSASTRPIATPKPRAAPRVSKSTTTRRSNIGDLVKKQPRRQFQLDDDNDFMEGAEPEEAHFANRRDWDEEWRERLDMYRNFLQPYLDLKMRDQYWHAKQEWRRGLATTEMLLTKKPAQKQTNEDTPKTSTRPQQMSLSRFFTGVKKLKVDIPDELVSNVRIPNDLFSGVKQILPLSVAQSRRLDEDKLQYYEVDDMLDCVGVLDALIEKDTPKGAQSPVEGILVDPPWEFYLEDGRNDGRCRWNLKDMQMLLDKVVSHMTAGLVFVWTHKMIQADVVRMMYTLDCKYVENLVWFKKSINNVQLDQPSPYFSSAKEILLMFKKGEGFELRHQRTADVIIDFEQPKTQWIHEEYTEPKPPAVYEMIETLLPRAGYDDTLKRGRLLDLWTKRAMPRREGWIAFHQRKENGAHDKPASQTAMEEDRSTTEGPVPCEIPCETPASPCE